MIVTNGKMIIVECGYESRFRLERDSRKPGVVVLIDKKDGASIQLPGNKDDAQSLIDGYVRTLEENMDYTPGEYENQAGYKIESK